MGRGVTLIGDWTKRARCASGEPGIDPRDFQVPLRGNNQNKAKLICIECPVQPECLRWALENGEIWGVWGGLDEARLRRTLSVDSVGRFTIRCRPPGCPNPRCRARPGCLEIVLLSGSPGLRCQVCGFEWRSETSVMAIRHYRRVRRAQDQRQLRIRARVVAAQVVVVMPSGPIVLGRGGEERSEPLSLVASVRAR